MSDNESNPNHSIVHDVIRKRLLHKIGLIEQSPYAHLSIQSLQRSEWSPAFEQHMRNRLVIGALRYGPFNFPGKRVFDRVKGINKRLQQYQETGNKEYLVDVANLALVEFVECRHPKQHFRSAVDGDHSCI